MQEIKSRGLTRDAIKMIAMLTMFFNHFSHVFLTAGTYPAEFLKGIGYFTAPVMCYFLVEGFYKTSSRRAYAKRLFVFALVSQVPYFLAFNREAAVLNMMFSLLFSFLILCVFHGEAFRRGKGQLQIAGLFFLSVFSDWSALAPAFTLLFDRAGQERKKLQKTFLFVTAVVGINEAASVAQTEGVFGFPEGAVRVLFSMTGPGEKRTAGYEMVLLRILSVASAFVVAGGPGNGNDVAAVWKRGAKIAAGLPKIEHMCYTLESNSTFTVRGRSVN